MEHAEFVHLHVHTQYSLLDGACILERLVDKAKACKLPALAITDHGNLYGAIKFYSLCVKNGIKPIIGCECYVAIGSRFNKEYKSGEESNHHIILLAKDEEGYRNLVRIVSMGHLEGFYYRPRIDKELLAQYSKGLIASSACLKGEIASCILSGNVDKAYKVADDYLQLFGRGNFYIEIMENGMDDQNKANKALVKLAKELDIPLIATNDIHYLNKEDAPAHEVLLCIQTQTTLNDAKRFKFSSDTFYFRTPDEMKAAFKEVPEAIANTLEVMQKCNLVMDFSKIHLPKFPVPDGMDDMAYLTKLCYANFSNRYPDASAVVKTRLDYELTVIKKTGFASYFLIVWDLIKYARDNGIPVGPGRGSAAGSVVSYLLRITDIDPLKYNLLFERFLNPARISMPDIDMDFCYENRSRVIEYVSKRYGENNVAQIVTFGTMQARAVVRDVGRAMGFSYVDVDKIAKMIPSAPGHSLDLKEALVQTPELNAVYNSSADIKRLIDVAVRLEGLSRHASTHAAGVVISDQPLLNRIPLVRGSDGEMVTAFDMESLEKTGMLKMDFLGLKTLTVIESTTKIVKRTKNIDIDIDNISLEDKKTFELLRNAETIGTFQLESRGMREILRKIIPTRFEDLIAVLALYRPGPLGSGMVDDFINRKQGTKKVTYLDPRLEPILKETYGIILYQEQTMQIVSALAGFDMAQADLLRKAIGKKIPEIMEEQRNKFVTGCENNNISERVATQIFDLIDFFSGYGFNKSHSAAYALISWRTAYLKANFPVEFMAALLTSERTNTDKIVEYINESGHMGIKVLPPDINTSYANFTVTGDKDIRFGLFAVKNVGEVALESIINVRREKKFADFFDFCERVDSRTVNKKVLESLIKCGAMDSFGFKRAAMAAALDRVLEKSNKKEDLSQMMLFDTRPHKDTSMPDVEEWPTGQILEFEKSLLGIYLTAHPLYACSKALQYLNRHKIATFYDDEPKVSEVIICGIIEKVRLMTTRQKGDRMAIIKVEDESANVEVFVFPRLFAEVSSLLAEKAIVLIRGRLETKEHMPKILASKIMPIAGFYSEIERVEITIDQNKDTLLALKGIFVLNKGTTPVVFKLHGGKFEGVKIKTSPDFALSLNEKTLADIGAIVGEANLSVVFKQEAKPPARNHSWQKNN